MRQTIRSHPWWTAFAVVIALNIVLLVWFGLWTHEYSNAR